LYVITELESITRTQPRQISTEHELINNLSLNQLSNLAVQNAPKSTNNIKFYAKHHRIHHRYDNTEHVIKHHLYLVQHRKLKSNKIKEHKRKQENRRNIKNKISNVAHNERGGGGEIVAHYRLRVLLPLLYIIVAPAKPNREEPQTPRW
jgi:hypothetical protein